MSSIADDLRVDAHTIERQLAELWRTEKTEGENAVTRAALWNVVAHTWTSAQHAEAAEILAKASASVPQRTMVVRADFEGQGSLSSWISANCHLVGGGRQVCSEEIAIVAAGDRVHHVAPLVKALLLPDMPVAVWWLGDLPDAQHAYAQTLLEPADRFIFDSSHFDGAADLDLVCRIVEQTSTAPADLNWARLQEWRTATAALFDGAAARGRLRAIRNIRVLTGGGSSFGELSEGLLYCAWMIAQLEADIAFELSPGGQEGGIGGVEIDFDDGQTASIRTDRDRRVVVSSDGSEHPIDCITRTLGRGPEDLIVRLLIRPEADKVYLKTLKTARDVAKRAMERLSS